MNRVLSEVLGLASTQVLTLYRISDKTLFITVGIRTAAHASVDPTAFAEGGEKWRVRYFAVSFQRTYP